MRPYKRCSFTRVASGHKDVVQCVREEGHSVKHLTLNPGDSRKWDTFEYTELEEFLNE